MTTSSDDDPISMDELARMLTEPLSKEDLELAEYGSELLGLDHLPKPGFSFEHMDNCEFESTPTKMPPNPTTIEDLERWLGLFQSELHGVLSVFLTPTEVEQALHDIGTEGFNCVIGYLQQVAQDAGPLPFGPYGALRDPNST